MSLQDELLAAIRPHGIDLARLYGRFRDHSQERIDFALQGLFVAGEIYRSNNMALPRLDPQQYRCSQCHALQPIDRMMEAGVCLRCVSDATISIDQSPTKRCPRCGKDLRMDSMLPGGSRARSR